ncbi:MAG: hypothetical protein ACREQV_13280 [Candidatus Binatia bacterium]
MSKHVTRLPRGKKRMPIDVVRARLRNHVEVVLASDNEVLIRMMERFFTEMSDRLIQDERSKRTKGEVVPIKRATSEPEK